LSRNVLVRAALIAIGVVCSVAAVLTVLGNRGSGSDVREDKRYLHTDAIARPCFAAPREYKTVPNGGDSFVVRDLDGDGRPDLAAANLDRGVVAVLTNSGAGRFERLGTFRTGAKPDWLEAGDLDGDHSPDLVTTNADGGTVSVLLNNGAGSFRPKADYRVGEVPSSVAIGDVDGDGSADLVTANQLPPDTSSILLNNGDGTFRAGRTFSTGHDVALSDVDGDGSQDLVALHGEKHVAVFLNAGGGSFEDRVDYRTGDGPTAIAIGDVNGDRRRDLVTANFGIEPMGVGYTLSVLMNKGDGTFGPKRDLETNEYPTSVVIADVMGNGKPDLVSADAETQNVTVLVNDGAGSFSERHEYSSDERPGGTASVAVADVNGDGRADILANLWHSVSVLVKNPEPCTDSAFVEPAH
jgi:hypothetical protein